MMTDGKKSKFKTSKQEFLALISHDHNDVNGLNEHIEPWVIKQQ